jgi:2-methylcitrate dehydratase
VKVKATAEADGRMPHAMFCKMELTTATGETHATIVEYHKGHWKNPLSDAEVDAKFQKLASAVLNERQSSRLLEALWRLDTLDDAGEVVRLTKAG